MHIEQEYKQYIQNHFIESKKSALAVTKAILNSELNAGGPAYTHTLQIPKFFSQEDKRVFKSVVDTMYPIFTKVIEAYRNDEDIRALFPFSKELEELILLKPRYEVPIPICRIDIFYNEETKDFKFCEFNTDGTSAMNENNRLNHLLAMNNVYSHDTHSYEIMELVQSWGQAFLELCSKTKDMPEKPMIAIVDFLDRAYINELYVFQSVFSHMGYLCEVLDIRDLEYVDGRLRSKHTKREIDVIYRRAVTKDITENMSQIPDFIQAVKEDVVSLVGAFQTQLIHHKEISKVLVHPKMQAYFTKEENEYIQNHLPATYDLTKEIIDKIQDKDRWILKPKDSYAAKGVWAGVDLSLDQWNKVIDDVLGLDYIVQEYIQPYMTENIDLVTSDEFKMYSNMTGLYVYNGNFAGVYSRCSDAGIISTQYNEKSIPTLFVEDE